MWPWASITSFNVCLAVDDCTLMIILASATTLSVGNQQCDFQVPGVTQVHTEFPAADQEPMQVQMFISKLACDLSSVMCQGVMMNSPCLTSLMRKQDAIHSNGYR